METVLITGGNGLLGRHLCDKLPENGYRPAILSRKPVRSSGIECYRWDPDKGEIDMEALARTDYVIHLTGVNIGGGRWTRKRKKLIIDSRVKTGKFLFDKMKESGTQLKAFVSISGTGYYGSVTSEKIFAETDEAADDFLGNVCRQWEEMAFKFADKGIRTVIIRSAPVLTRSGGILGSMSVPVRLGIGSPIGTGKQYFPWIHAEDLCSIFIKAVGDVNMSGVFNTASPEHTTNRDFIRILAGVLKKPFWFPPIPVFLMKIIFGEMSEMLLTGSRISSDKIRSSGYVFKFPGLETALKNLLEG
ncbi:MAG: TIGR01777 family oxidoreductase [Bacteroidota bacterium]|nr:TIGR01777 family oxidoreductase [Bacteroidota bacterium]